MARRPAAITQADVARAIRAAQQTGAAEVRIEGGTIRILLGPSPLSTEQPVDKPEVML